MIVTHHQLKFSVYYYLIQIVKNIWCTAWHYIFHKLIFNFKIKYCFLYKTWYLSKKSINAKKMYCKQMNENIYSFAGYFLRKNRRSVFKISFSEMMTCQLFCLSQELEGSNLRQNCAAIRLKPLFMTNQIISTVSKWCAVWLFWLLPTIICMKWSVLRKPSIDLLCFVIYLSVLY